MKSELEIQLERAIKHYTALQKRYTKTHNGKMCEITELTLAVLRERYEYEIVLKHFSMAMAYKTCSRENEPIQIGYPVAISE